MINLTDDQIKVILYLLEIEYLRQSMFITLIDGKALPNERSTELAKIIEDIKRQMQ